MKKTVRNSILVLFSIVLFVGVIFLSISILKFPEYISSTNELRQFDDARSLYNFSTDDSSGTYDEPSTISLPKLGLFEIKLYCDDAKERKHDPFAIELTVNTLINGTPEIINLDTTSYVHNAYPRGDGTQIVNPMIDMTWQSNEFDIDTNLTLTITWQSNFKGWYLKVLYANETFNIQREQIVTKKMNCLTYFIIGLPSSIIIMVIGAGGLISSIILLKVKKKR